MSIRGRPTEVAGWCIHGRVATVVVAGHVKVVVAEWGVEERWERIVGETWAVYKERGIQGVVKIRKRPALSNGRIAMLTNEK